MEQYIEYERQALEEAHAVLRAIREAARQPRERLFLILRFRETRLWHAVLLLFCRGELQRVADLETRRDLMSLASLQYYLTNELWTEDGLVQRMQSTTTTQSESGRKFPMMRPWLEARVPTHGAGAQACYTLMYQYRLQTEADGDLLIRMSSMSYSEERVESLVGISFSALMAVYAAFRSFRVDGVLADRRPEHIVRLAEEVALRLPDLSESRNVCSHVGTLLMHHRFDEAWALIVCWMKTARVAPGTSRVLRGLNIHAGILRWMEGTEAMLCFLGGRPKRCPILSFRERDGDQAVSARVRAFLVGETRPNLAIELPPYPNNLN